MSTFTNWNGPQGSNVRTSDILALINEYQSLISKLEAHIAQTASADNVHQIKTYVDNIKSEVLAAIPNVSSFITQVTADDRYALKSQIPTDYATTGMLGSYVTTSALTSTLANYLKTNDLSANTVITAIKSDISSLKAYFDDPETFTYPVLKATKYIEGLVHAIEQVQFTFKSFGATVGGSNDRGVYYILGMLDECAGTAYIRFTNTKSFAAVVQFAVTKNTGTGEYIDGQLSVVTDVDSADLSNVHFLIVQGTNANGDHHVYLAIQADEWMKRVEESGIINAGVFSKIQFEGSGINFYPVDSKGYVSPNSTTAVLFDFNYYAIEDRIAGIETRLDNISFTNDIGEIVFWPKYDSNGVAVDVPYWAHACDGSDVDPALTDVIAVIGSKYPIQDYAIIRIKKAANV